MKNNVKFFSSIVDDTAKQQIWDLAACEAYQGSRIRVMPDCHAGKGCTVGSVIEFHERVVPNTVGVDIGCGMLVMVLGHVDVDLAELDRIVNEKVPSGFNIHEKPVSDFDCNLGDLMADIKDTDYILRSAGTLGGGNHFIELNQDDEGCKYLVIHSGRRHLGVEVCKFWQHKAIERLTDDRDVRRELIERLKAEGRATEIQAELKKITKPKINEELAYLEGDDLKGYLNDMVLCQNFATHNRYMMARIILNNLGLQEMDSFVSIHNYIEMGNLESPAIIRKGAISAKKGERVIIPMNMRDGSLICIGKGNEDWLCSAPHGAGRLMSRAQAAKEIDLAEFKESMKGIYTTSVCEETKDEAPMVYKPTEVIMKDIQDTVEIVKVIKPVYNFKAKDSKVVNN